MQIIKYPRIMVSVKRHKALKTEAAKRGVSMETLAEEKFKKAENKNAGK